MKQIQTGFQPGFSLQAVSLCLVLRKCLEWLFLLGFISFWFSIHCLDLWLCLNSKIAEPALFIPPQAPSDLLHFLLWGLSLYLEMVLSCGKPAGTLVPVRCNAWPCRRLRDLPMSFCLQIFRLPNLTPQLLCNSKKFSKTLTGCKTTRGKNTPSSVKLSVVDPHTVLWGKPLVILPCTTSACYLDLVGVVYCYNHLLCAQVTATYLDTDKEGAHKHHMGIAWASIYIMGSVF